MSGELLRLLACPRCQGELDGEGSSRVYTCAACRTARFMPAPEKAFPLVYLEAAVPSEGRRTLYAPFWRLEGRASWRCEEGSKAGAYRAMTPLGSLYFPAFWNPKAPYHENLTQAYALLPEPPREAEAGAGPILPGVVDPANLARMACLTWLGYLDRVQDVTGVELRFEASSVAYAAVPFFRGPKLWVDGVLGHTFPDAYFFGLR